MKSRIFKWENIYHISSKQQRALTRGYEQEGLVQFVIDSVYALAHALHNYLKSKCKTKMKDCSLLQSPNRQELCKRPFCFWMESILLGHIYHMVNNDLITCHTGKNNRWSFDPKEPIGNAYQAIHIDKL
jgi:hypothetical protein